MNPRGASIRPWWYAAALLAVGTYAAMIAPAEKRVADVTSHARELYELTERNQRYIDHLSSLESVRRRVENDISRYGSGAEPGKAPVALVGVLQRVAKAHLVVVTGIAEETDAGARIRDGDDLRITLEGRYRDVLAAVADVPRHEALVDFQTLSLERAAGNSTLFPPVDATIRATIYHSPWDTVKENDRAVTR